MVETLQLLKVGHGALDLRKLHSALSQTAMGSSAAAVDACIADLQGALATPLSSILHHVGSPLATAPIQDVLMM